VINHSLPGRARIFPEDPAEDEEIVSHGSYHRNSVFSNDDGYYLESGRKEMTAYVRSQDNFFIQGKFRNKPNDDRLIPCCIRK
jgi:general stress protein YciG